SGPITWWPGSCSAMMICSPGRPGPSPDPLDSLLPLARQPSPPMEHPSPPMERNDDVLTTTTYRRLGPGGRECAGLYRMLGWGRRRRLGRAYRDLAAHRPATVGDGPGPLRGTTAGRRGVHPHAAAHHLGAQSPLLLPRHPGDGVLRRPPRHGP